MKPIFLIAFTSAGLLMGSPAEEPKKHTEAEKAQALVKHQKGSEKVSIDQDKQAANAQELLAEQTSPKVIELLNEAEMLMGKATDRLEDGDTNGDTIAMQTEIIEKIYEAAKAKNSQPGSSPGMGAMLDMMSQMMGKKPGEKPGKKPGESDKGGEGSKGASDSANTENKGKTDTDPAGQRRVPRAAGKSGTKLPPEFQRALDGYNKKTKNK